jgi:protein-S-isoprenylcysteine O-methyltransferase Ste14
MQISLLRIYLLAGLLLHKAVWEIMKARAGVGAPKRKPHPLSAVKVIILLGILAQTVLPEILPVASAPTLLRAIGFTLYTLGLATAITARIQLGWNWSDIEKSCLKQDHALVARGLYRYIRHPIYAGDLALLLGLEFALNSWLALGILGLAIYVHRQAIREERQLMQALPGYDDYCRQTSRFLPFLA